MFTMTTDDYRDTPSNEFLDNTAVKDGELMGFMEEHGITQEGVPALLTSYAGIVPVSKEGYYALVAVKDAVDLALAEGIQPKVELVYSNTNNVAHIDVLCHIDDSARGISACKMRRLSPNVQRRLEQWRRENPERVSFNIRLTS